MRKSVFALAVAVPAFALASVIGSIPAVSAFTLEGKRYQNTNKEKTAIGIDWLVGFGVNLPTTYHCLKALP